MTGRARGSALVVVLVVLTVVMVIALGLAVGARSHLGATRSYASSTAALASAESGLAEVRWRLDRPAGQLVTVNGLVNYPARIDPDPDRILGNGSDDDRDGVTDEPDELNLARDWAVRVVLRAVEVHPGPPLEEDDRSIPLGPPWGDRGVVPTVQRTPDWLLYSTADPGALEVLVVTFLRDVDTAVGDSEGDGPEIVFYDPALITNGIDDRNTLTGLGGDGSAGNDGPFNLDWSGGGARVAATGQPVVRVRAIGRIVRGDRSEARRPVEAWFVAATTAAGNPGICGCTEVSIEGFGSDSYRSSEGSYGSAGLYAGGHVATNGDLDLRNRARIQGDAVAGGSMALAKNTRVTGSATAGGVIHDAAQVDGTALPFASPVPRPCACDVAAVDDRVRRALAVNDNATILPNGVNPYLYPTSTVDVGTTIYKKGLELDLKKGLSIILPGGTYFFESIDLNDAVVQVGRDLDGDGVVDAAPLAPVTVVVAGGVRLKGSSRLGGLRPEDLRLEVADRGKKAVELDGSAVIVGVITAPAGGVDLAKDAAIDGSVTAASIQVKGDAALHYDEDLVIATPVASGYRQVLWREGR